MASRNWLRQSGSVMPKVAATLPLESTEFRGRRAAALQDEDDDPFVIYLHNITDEHQEWFEKYLINDLWFEYRKIS